MHNGHDTFDSVPPLDDISHSAALVSHAILTWGRAMPGYRLYLMNDAGHIREVGEFYADNDSAAIGAVERARGNDRMELWCGTHKLMHWDARPVNLPEVSA